MVTTVPARSCSRTDGEVPPRANNLRRREWPKAVALAGLDPQPTFHDMRHTAVSLWIAAGASDLEVAKWAGHRSVSFTKDRYAHLFPEHGMALADRLDAFIRTATPTPAAPRATLRLEALPAADRLKILWCSCGAAVVRAFRSAASEPKNRRTQDFLVGAEGLEPPTSSL